MIIRKNILLKIEEGDITDGTCIIPNGITRIHDAAFRDCLELKRLIVPKGVTHIGSLTFWNCRNLKAIRFPDGLSSIGNAAFRGCETLEELIFPKGMKNIGKVAFSGCTNLRTVVFEERGTHPAQCLQRLLLSGANSKWCHILPHQVYRRYLHEYFIRKEKRQLYRMQVPEFPGTVTDLLGCRKRWYCSIRHLAYRSHPQSGFQAPKRPACK